MSLPLLVRATVLAVALVVASAASALAHPFFEPAEAPVDSLATLTLDLAHGCTGDGAGHDEDGEGLATREVALEVPEEVTHVAPAETDGWEVATETADDGRVEVLVLTAAEGAEEPAPRFELDTVHRGEPGQEAHWRVVQDCGEVTHRWVGTPDEPADEPSVAVTLVEQDPDAPPPEDAGGDTTDADADRDADEADEGAGAGEEPAEDAAEDAPAAEATGDEAAAEDGGGLPGWVLVLGLLVILAAGGVLLARRGRGADTGGTSDGGRA